MRAPRPRWPAAGSRGPRPGRCAPGGPGPLRAALTTFAAFLLAGSLPLAVFILRIVAPGAVVRHPFSWSAGLTLVAFGTSLPELMTAIASIRKGHPEIMVGNVIGADVLNCLFVIGAAAFAEPLAVPPNFFILHFPAMLIILWSFRLFISTTPGGYFKRAQGAWLLSIYVIYIIVQYTLK